MDKTYNQKEIGHRIKRVRTKNGQTQAQLAEVLNISVNYLSEIENGKKGLSPETICKICTLLNISADYLLFGKEEALSGQDIINISTNLNNDDLDIVINYLKSLQNMRKI